MINNLMLDLKNLYTPTKKPVIEQVRRRFLKTCKESVKNMINIIHLHAGIDH